MFSDRLNTLADVEWFEKQQAAEAHTHFRAAPEDLLQEGAKPMFASIGQASGAYAEVPGWQKLQALLASALSDYNALSKAPMNLVGAAWLARGARDR